MRRSMGLAAALLGVALVGCSSGDSISITVTYRSDGEGPSAVPFRASGEAVEAAVVCESGTMESDHTESPEGEVITLEETVELYEATRAAEGTMDTYWVQEFICDDESGTFTIKMHYRDDYAKRESQQDIPTWQIENGTGDYANLSGSGDASDGSWLGGPPIVLYSGEVQTG